MLRKLLRCWVPIGSFGLALALSFIAGSPVRTLLARQAGGTTGCSCTFKFMSQSGTLTWETEGPNSAVLAKFSITNSATVCTSSEPPGLIWSANWTVTNLTVSYTAEIKGVPKPITTSVVPQQYGGVFGSCPCKPGQSSASFVRTVDLSVLRMSLEENLTSMLAKKNPGSAVKVTVHTVSIGPSFDTTVSGSGGCGPAQGPLPMSIATYSNPKSAKKGKGTNSVTYTESCP